LDLCESTKFGYYFCHLKTLNTLGSCRVNVAEKLTIPAIGSACDFYNTQSLLAT